MAVDRPGETPADESAKPVARVPDVLKLPIFGEVSIAKVSLPLLTIMLAAVDGFNPCAMWTLLFLIGLLVGLRNRFRMWVLGSAFIVASAAVYYLFMAAWLNLLLFFGMLLWIRILVGMLAVGGGTYYLREYFVNPEAICRVTARNPGNGCSTGYAPRQQWRFARAGGHYPAGPCGELGGTDLFRRNTGCLHRCSR